jgi:lysophospholipase L1-like esterase
MILLGIKPIWLSIAPLRDGTVWTVMNNYFKNNFDYVDISQIFYNENGDIDTEMYSDGTHPSVLGYQRIYNIVKSRCAEIFEV